MIFDGANVSFYHGRDGHRWHHCALHSFCVYDEFVSLRSRPFDRCSSGEGTFSGFKSEATSGACIDWIGACGNLGVLFLGGKRPAANLDTIGA